MRIGTATCRAWSKRVSVTRPPQSPCNAQACHYHATLSTMGSIRARTQPCLRCVSPGPNEVHVRSKSPTIAFRQEQARRVRKGGTLKRGGQTHLPHCVVRGSVSLEIEVVQSSRQPMTVDPSYWPGFVSQFHWLGRFPRPKDRLEAVSNWLDRANETSDGYSGLISTEEGPLVAINWPVNGPRKVHTCDFVMALFSENFADRTSGAWLFCWSYARKLFS